MLSRLYERLSKDKRQELTSYVDEQLEGLEFDGPTVDSLLERLAGQHEIAFKESNRYLSIYLVAVIFYIFKLAGMRFDILLIGQKVSDDGYGLFLFCAASLVFFSLAALRAADASVLEEILGALCSRTKGKAGDLFARSYVSGGVWMHTLIDITPRVEGRKSFAFVSTLLWCTYGPLMFSVIVSPLITGIYFIYDHENQIIGSYEGLQFYSIVALFLCATISGLYTMSVVSLNDLE